MSLKQNSTLPATLPLLRLLREVRFNLDSERNLLAGAQVTADAACSRVLMAVWYFANIGKVAVC